MGPSLAQHGTRMPVLCPDYTVAYPANVAGFGVPSAARYEMSRYPVDT
jgi:hypothetical protein